LAGALLVRHAPHAVADAYCSTRLTGQHESMLGTLPGKSDFAAIIERAR
jgi:putative acyl-CoA dehydrogenase